MKSFNALRGFFVLLISIIFYIDESRGRGLWVPRMGMMRVLRRPNNPFHLTIEPPILLTRKRLLDSKSSEESSENTDDDDSPDTLEYSDYWEDLKGDFKDGNDDHYDSNNALEDFSSGEDPVITLPDRQEFFS
ncbi:uncharacterized protein LOC132201283 [Neocloeon triangulifer]|uniref:uncharacterized protein LOC132201283 n=1 Tax=Neocloeon triangulifer TaxID=2078957 RepID=UPI00286F4013|nr:uncharacterized protein LOC132201283 [Neocloeon triangulifer]